jgi:hypothetical protein
MAKKIQMERVRASFEHATAAVLESEIEFAGKTWKPDQARAYIVATLCHSFPTRNSNGHGITAATLANSVSDAVNRHFDFEHQLAYYSNMFSKQAKGSDVKIKDRICGCIAAVEFPSKEDAVAAAEKGEKVPFKILVALWRHAEGVDAALAEMIKDPDAWLTSMEWEFNKPDSAFAFQDDDGNTKIVAWDAAPEKYRTSVKAGVVANEALTLLTGGVDGKVLITGGAFVRVPADKGATVDRVAASDQTQGITILNGWRTKTDWQDAIASQYSTENLQPKPLIVHAKKVPDLIVGQTEESQGHKHDILKDLTAFEAADGHSHWLRVIEYDKASNSIQGVSSTHTVYGSEYQVVSQHSHKFRLGKSVVASSEATPAAGHSKEDSRMNPKEVAVFLRKQAQELDETSPVRAAMLRQADDLDKSGVAQDAEGLIEARIKAGDLIPKAKHAAELADAEKRGEAKVRDELVAKEKAESEAKASFDARAEKVKGAQLDLAFQIRKDKTIEQVVHDIPAGEAGDKLFAERLEEWQCLKAQTGQAVAAAQAASKPTSSKPAGGVPSTGASTESKVNLLGV